MMTVDPKNIIKMMSSVNQLARGYATTLSKFSISSIGTAPLTSFCHWSEAVHGKTTLSLAFMQ
jgi:hypothetical protein